MKFISSLLAAFAIANPVPADDPAPADNASSNMDTDIIMINMNMANIQERQPLCLIQFRTK